MDKPNYLPYLSSKFSKKLQLQLAFEEGVKLNSYPDPVNPQIITVGIGHNKSASPRWPDTGHPIPDTLTLVEVFKLLEFDLIDSNRLLKNQWRYYATMPSGARRDALLAMAFQLGTASLMQFNSLLKEVRRENWEAAAGAALASKWATQCPNRAKRVAGQLASGVYYVNT